MNIKPSTTEKNGVILSRPGAAEQEYTLPDGATLADLLQKAQVHTKGPGILIDGRPLEEFIILQPGMTVTIVPEAKDALDDRWRESIGMFADDPAFRELVEAVEASREAEKDRS